MSATQPLLCRITARPLGVSNGEGKGREGEGIVSDASVFWGCAVS